MPGVRAPARIVPRAPGRCARLCCSPRRSWSSRLSAAWSRKPRAARRRRPHALRHFLARPRPVRGLARRRPGGPSRTFGFRRAEILAALVQRSHPGGDLVLDLLRGLMRFSDPPEVEAGLMSVIALVGLAVNLASARILHAHAGENLNVSAAFRHVLADLAGSVGVIAAGLIILLTGWEYADPVVSALIGLLVLGSSWTILRDSTRILLEASPPGIDVEDVGNAMATVPGVDSGSRSPRLDDHLRLPGPRRARPRQPRDGLPSDPSPARTDAGRALRARAHDAAGRSRGRRSAADRDRLGRRQVGASRPPATGSRPRS